MKIHKVPCNCETCEKARYWQSCAGCKDGHPSFWKTVILSPQWQLWQKEQKRRFINYANSNKKPENFGIYDMPEVEECGWISAGHFQEFLKFVSERG